METSFDKLGINQNLVEGLKKEKIYEPMAIQEAAIPPALENKDIIGQSITGPWPTCFQYLKGYRLTKEKPKQ